ncbi:hypothetical protein [Microbacterium sp. gxy059]|uniref:hypothetical protein n=1 Tax=Microbacterium sp. gxy059 TaxID=2957199 RepID=UPI003D95DE2F
MGTRTSIIRLTLFSPDAQTVEGMAAARTAETRERIRRWPRIETGGIATALAGVALLMLAPLASVAVAIWSGVADGDPAAPMRGIWGTAVGVAGIGVLAWGLGSSRRRAVCFSDGYESLGVVDRAIEHPGSGDEMTWWDLRISAVLPDGTTMRRRLHLEGEHHDRRVGGPVRFRHSTLDTEALDDIHVVARPGRPSGRGHDD